MHFLDVLYVISLCTSVVPLIWRSSKFHQESGLLLRGVGLVPSPFSASLVIGDLGFCSRSRGWWHQFEVLSSTGLFVDARLETIAIRGEFERSEPCTCHVFSQCNFHEEGFTKGCAFTMIMICETSEVWNVEVPTLEGAPQ